MDERPHVGKIVPVSDRAKSRRWLDSPGLEA
jgi:hypothetical protein